ncbi:hypothetical protein ACFLYO_04210 [Chloroflexota bacterium]
MAAAELLLATQSAALATAADARDDLVFEMTRQAAAAQSQLDDWQALVTLQAGVYATQVAGLNAILSTQDAVLVDSSTLPPVIITLAPTVTDPPTITGTASPTIAPTETPTASATMTVTASPTVTATATPSLTLTPSVTPTPFLCWVLAANQDGVNIREEPRITPDNVILSIPANTALSVAERMLDSEERVWYAVRVERGPDRGLEGWVAGDIVEELTDCPTE